MKQLAGILIITVFIFSCNSEKSNLKSDLEVSNLKGKVREIHRTIHKVENSRCPAAEKANCNEKLYVFNKKGNLSESTDLDSDGQTVLTSKYVYNRQDLCSEINKYSDEKLKEKEVNIYQGDKVTEINKFNEDGTIQVRYKYEYSDNELTVEKILNKAGEVVSSIHNDFLNGQLDSQTEKNGIGDISFITKYKRNTNNDIIESIRSYPKDSSEIKFTFDYEYDNQGNWIKQTQSYEGEIAGIIVRNITYYTD